MLQSILFLVKVMGKTNNSCSYITPSQPFKRIPLPCIFIVFVVFIAINSFQHFAIDETLI